MAKINGFTPQVYDNKNDIWESLGRLRPYKTAEDAKRVLEAYKGPYVLGRILTIEGWVNPRHLVK